MPPSFGDDLLPSYPPRNRTPEACAPPWACPCPLPALASVSRFRNATELGDGAHTLAQLQGKGKRASLERNHRQHDMNSDLEPAPYPHII